MLSDSPPPHAVFIRWRNFQAGIFGLPAIIAVSAILSVALVIYFLR